jgi:hypothetical protein
MADEDLPSDEVSRRVGSIEQVSGQLPRRGFSNRPRPSCLPQSTALDQVSYWVPRSRRYSRRQYFLNQPIELDYEVSGRPLLRIALESKNGGIELSS